MTAPKFAVAGNRLGAVVGGGGGAAVPTPDKLLLRLVAPALIAITPL